MSQSLLLDYENTEVTTKLLLKDPEAVLKNMIALRTRGIFSTDDFHLVVRSVMNTEDNKVKRLLYYFFETFYKEEKDFIICINTVNKDLGNANEYVRGFALQFVSRVESYEYGSLFLKGVRENLAHSSYYVRMNAVHCLGELAHRFDMDAEDDIAAFMKRENSAEALIVGFHAMHKLGMNFEEFLNQNYPREVLEYLSRVNQDQGFLRSLTESKHLSVRYNACCALLLKGGEDYDGHRHQSDDDTLRGECFNEIVSILKMEPGLKRDFIPYLKYVTSFSPEFLELIDCYEPEFSSGVIDACFRNAETGHFYLISDFLYKKYMEGSFSSEKKSHFKIMLLDKMSVFVNTHCIYINDMVSQCLKNLSVDDPELQYSSLGFLSHCMDNKENSSKIMEFLINAFSEMKFGKIIRRVFDILAENSQLEYFNCLLLKINSDFKAEVLPFYLSCEPDIYIGSYISICLVTMHKKEYNMKELLLALLLKFMQHGDTLGIIDFSSKSTISTCIRAVLHDTIGGSGGAVPCGSSGSDSHFIEFTNVNVLEPLHFSLLKSLPKMKKFNWDESVDLRKRTIQLSGLGDPLYVETNILISTCEILLDVLIINQTTSYLQNVIMDFGCSKNINQVSYPDTFSLQPNSAIALKLKFDIVESLNTTISSYISFKYPKNNDYSGKNFVQNLEEISLTINDFLEPADGDFQGNWKSLEWENVYSISLGKKIPDILLNVVSLLNGKLIKKLESSGFIVANIACYTVKKTLILINVSVNITDNSLVEFRIRSKDEDIVKSVSSVLSNYLKSL